MAEALRILLVGDLVLDEPDAPFFFDAVRDTLRTADLVIGHVEVPHTRRGAEMAGDIPAPASDPENLRALGGAGFGIVTLAGNHVFDRGAEGIADTRQALTDQGIAVCGAGENLDAARRPAIVTVKGRRVGVLSYNCVGPEQSWAAENKAGCAYVQVLTHYEPMGANPGGPPKVFSFPETVSLERMQDDVARLRPEVDMLVTAFHKGLVHTPAKLAMYERAVTKAAVEAGADIVVGHHSHIAHGIELYRGKPVFHGLGNFVTVTRALAMDNDHPGRAAWARARREIFGFEPDPAYPLYPFHPEARNALIAECTLREDGAIQAGFLPCWIRPSGQPEVLGDDARGRAVAAYIEEISARAGLAARFTWRDGRVAVN